MEKIIKYIADDGEEFDNEEDCTKYENILNITKNEEILMLDKNFRKLTGDSSSALSLVVYLFFKNKNSVLSYNKCANYFGFMDVCDDFYGMWLVYNEPLGVWESIDNKFKELVNLKKRLDKTSNDIDDSN